MSTRRVVEHRNRMPQVFLERSVASSSSGFFGTRAQYLILAADVVTRTLTAATQASLFFAIVGVAC